MLALHQCNFQIGLILGHGQFRSRLQTFPAGIILRRPQVKEKKLEFDDKRQSSSISDLSGQNNQGNILSYLTHFA